MTDPVTLTVEVALAAVKVLGAVAPDVLALLEASNGVEVDRAIELARTAIPPRWDTTKEDAARRQAVLERKRAAAEEFASKFKRGDRVKFDKRFGTVEEIDVATERMLVAAIVTDSPIEVWVPFDEIKKA